MLTYKHLSDEDEEKLKILIEDSHRWFRQYPVDFLFQEDREYAIHRNKWILMGD